MLSEFFNQIANMIKRALVAALKGAAVGGATAVISGSPVERSVVTGATMYAASSLGSSVGKALFGWDGGFVGFWMGLAAGYSQRSRAYRTYQAGKRRVQTIWRRLVDN